jgi:hypothetical protein
MSNLLCTRNWEWCHLDTIANETLPELECEPPIYITVRAQNPFSFVIPKVSSSLFRPCPQMPTLELIDVVVFHSPSWEILSQYHSNHDVYHRAQKQSVSHPAFLACPPPPTPLSHKSTHQVAFAGFLPLFETCQQSGRITPAFNKSILGLIDSQKFK